MNVIDPNDPVLEKLTAREAKAIRVQLKVSKLALSRVGRIVAKAMTRP